MPSTYNKDKDNNPKSYAIFLVIMIIFSVNCQEDQLDPYEVLGIKRSASQDQIKSRFRQLSRQYHPDKINKQNVSESKPQQSQKFLQIAQAYDKLKKNGFRPQYYSDNYEGKFSDQNYSDQSSRPNQNYDYNLWKMRIFFDLIFNDDGDSQSYAKKQRDWSKNLSFQVLLSHYPQEISDDFIYWVLSNTTVLAGSFFISVGLFALITSVSKDKQKGENFPNNKQENLRLNVQKLVVKPQQDLSTTLGPFD